MCQPDLPTPKIRNSRTKKSTRCTIVYCVKAAICRLLYIYKKKKITCASFIFVVGHAKYVGMRWFWMFVKCRFYFTEPTTDFNLSVTADDTLIFEYQHSMFSDIFTYLVDNCKIISTHNLITLQYRRSIKRHYPRVYFQFSNRLHALRNPAA